MEKTLFNQVGEVKGSATEHEDSFSFQFTPQNENLKKTRGALFTLVTASGAVDDRYEKAKSIYQQLQSSYYAKTSGSILHSLSDTLDHLTKEVLSKEEGEGVHYSVLAAVFWGSVLYLGKIGSGAVFVARGAKVKRLEFSKVASGVLEDQDTICLATEKLAEGVSLEDLQEALNQENFEKALETLDQKIGKLEGAVCDVVRLSVNAPGEAAAASLAIAEVDEKGNPEEAEKIEAPVETVETEEATLEEKIAEEAQEKEELKEEKIVPEVAPPRLGDPFESSAPKKASIFTTALVTARLYGQKAFDFIAKPWRKPEPGEEVDPVGRRKARIIQIVSVIGIILLLSLFFGFFNKRSENKSTQVDSKITEAQKNLETATTLKTVDPVQALTLVEQANEDLAAAEKKDPDNEQIKTLKEQSSDLEAEITKTTKIDKLDTVFDFTKLKKDTTLNDAALLGNQMLLLDQTKATVYSLTVSTKQGLEVSGSNTSPQTVTSFTTGFYLTNLEGINKLDTSFKVTNVGTNANWGKIVSSATYKGSLYLLDTGKNEIWKYLSTSQGLGSGKAYIVGEKPDLSSATSMAIEDYVWVANKNGTIYKFALGKKENVTINGLADPLSDVVDIFTSGSVNSIYILDQGKGRIVVLDKQGNYQATYANSTFHEANFVIADEAQKTAYIGASGKVYSFKLP